MSGGGAGGSGTQRYEWNEALQRPWEDAIFAGNELRQRGLERYPGQRIAFFDDDQVNAMQGIRNFAHNPQDYLYGKGNQQFQSTLAGDYLTGSKANPFTQTASPYEHENPYFNQVVDRGMQKITDNYQRGTSADTTRLFNLSGAFGGSAHQDAIKNNEEVLAEQLGEYDAQMRGQQYDRSANLHENFLNRGASSFEGERGRMMQAGGASQADQGLTLERLQGLMGVGDIERGLQQDFMNQDFMDWQEGQNHPFKMLDFFTGLLGRAQGGVSPTMYQTTPGYQASPFSQLLGGGLMASSLFGGRR